MKGKRQNTANPENVFICFTEHATNEDKALYCEVTINIYLCWKGPSADALCGLNTQHFSQQKLHKYSILPEVTVSWSLLLSIYNEMDLGCPEMSRLLIELNARQNICLSVMWLSNPPQLLFSTLVQAFSLFYWGKGFNLAMKDMENKHTHGTANGSISTATSMQ